jgi:xanthine dehydrogenase accessory factor
VFLFFEKLNELIVSRRPFVQVTVVDTNGSVPQDVGSKMLVTEEGLYFGTVGGGKVEARAIMEAKAMLSETIPNSKDHEHANESEDVIILRSGLKGGANGSGSSVSGAKGTVSGNDPPRISSRRINRHAPLNTRFCDWSLSKDIGMTCGGSVKMFLEAFHVNAWRITIFGAGHIANALIRLLVNLDCQITCYDTREEWLSKLPEVPRLTKICSPSLISEVAGLGRNDFVILMTMGHTTDMPVLVEILKSPLSLNLPYIGVIGSDAKAARLRKDVLDAGLTEVDSLRFRCPIGMPFGTNDPGEIAVSIVAQLLEVRDGKRAAHLLNHCEMIRIGSDS